MKYFLFIFNVLFAYSHLNAQIQATTSSAEIMHDIKKLKVLGSVLYIAAHPDDENTRLIAWLANHEMYRTGYLSLTRGDGGQNLIGDEQGVELGMIRTQELLAARRIDGGEQFFSRAFDFGFSKNPAEAFRIWDKNKVLSDVTGIIRRFQPDVIIARFPEDARAGHGHHSASGIMAREGYVAAADPGQFTDQLEKGVTVWQAKRLLWNTFNFGTSNTIDSTQFALEVGQFDPLLGKSIGELAGESRSQHKSQGFGVSRQRGDSKEFFSPLKGEAPRKSLMDGINTNWSRVEGGNEIETIINKVIADYNYENPAASLPMLRQLVGKMQGLPESVWKRVKMEELQKIILHCAGIYTEVTISTPGIIPGDSTNVAINIINRSNVAVTLRAVNIADKTIIYQNNLSNNVLFRRDAKVIFSGGIMETQPYWLREAPEVGSFNVAEKRMIGMPENQPLSATFLLTIDSVELVVKQPIQYRFVDPVKAEQYQPAYFTSQFLLFNAPGIVLFKKGSKDSATLQLNVTGIKKASAQNASFNVASQQTAFKKSLSKKGIEWAGGDVYSTAIKIPNYLIGQEKETDLLDVSFKPGGSFGDAEFYNARRSIEYDHIPTQTWHYRDQVKVLHIDLKTSGKNIGYLPGAGDKVVASLIQMGYTVTELKEEDIKLNVLKQYDAIIMGIRAYNIHDYLANAYNDLMEYVKGGGNLIVQYNTNNFISQLKGKIAPYNFTIGRTRITDENAVVDFLLPQHPVLNFPNKISQKDFEGWVQERSIYHAEGLDSIKWQMPLALTDPGETAQPGSLAIAPYGKGNFVYTGIVFFRELPAGVPGAYRLLANLIALPRHKE